MVLIEDIDGDGRDELLRIRNDRLEIIDGATGKPTACATLDNDGYSQLLTARFSRESGRHILVKPIGDGLKGHPYGCPVVAFDSDLKPYWPRRDFEHAGHTPGAFDVDGDGLDELLIGTQCVNHDGSIRWTLPLAARNHPDRRTVVDVDDDGRMEQVLAFEGDGLVVTDLEGNVLRVHPVDHCGEALVGKFYADRPGLQIFGDNQNWRVGDDAAAVASYMLDSAGDILWESTVNISGARPINWRTEFGPQALLVMPHVPDPEDARPFIMDGAGNRIVDFDIPLHLPLPEDFDLPHERIKPFDWGDHYSYDCLDFDGSGAKIVIWTRRDLWIFDGERG